MRTKKIRIKNETYDRIMKKGRMGDTVDDIIKKILDNIDIIEVKDVKDPRIEKSVMNLRTTKKHEWIPR